jgi:hypothetical protein
MIGPINEDVSTNDRPTAVPQGVLVSRHSLPFALPRAIFKGIAAIPLRRGNVLRYMLAADNAVIFHVRRLRGTVFVRICPLAKI